MMTQKTPDRRAETARVILEKERAAALSMRRVADSIGMTAMAIHRHYPNRDTLAQKIADDTFAEITASWVAVTKSANRGRVEDAPRVPWQLVRLDLYPHSADLLRLAVASDPSGFQLIGRGSSQRFFARPPQCLASLAPA